MCNIAQDIQDIQAVVHHLRHQLGYRVELIVGHSRGSLDAWAYLGRDERLERMDAGEQADKIVLAAEREDRVDQVVANPGLALLNLEAVGKEVEQLPNNFLLEICKTRACRTDSQSSREKHRSARIPLRLFSAHRTSGGRGEFNRSMQNRE